MADRIHVKRLRRALEAFEEATDVVAGLEAARAVREAAEALENAKVNEARRAGVTWEEIGWIYDMTRQGAQQRFKDAGGKRGGAR
jgi:hypothetical protein